MYEPALEFFAEQYTNFVHYLVMQSNLLLWNLNVLLFVYFFSFFFLSLNQSILVGGDVKLRVAMLAAVARAGQWVKMALCVEVIWTCVCIEANKSR